MTERSSAFSPRKIVDLLGPLLALLVVIAIFAILDRTLSDGHFLSARNFRTMTTQNCVVAVAALGMTVIIISGGIDLSVGTAIALSATVLASCLIRDVNPLVAIAAGIAAGFACGLANGVLISALRMPPFIVSLGTMTIYLGIGKWLSGNTTVRPSLKTQIPPWLVDLLGNRADALWAGFPPGVWLAALCSVLLAAVLRYTVFGRYVFALGSNEQTARLCGVPVSLTKIAVYALGGLFVGLAGVYQFSRLSSGNPTSGSGLELQVIAAVVIGGGSLSGGRGTVLGTLAGAAIMAVINSGCTQLGMSNAFQDMMLGVVIIGAVMVDQLRQRWNSQ